MMSSSLMNMKGMMMPAHAIDEHVVAQNDRRAQAARYFTPRRASGIKATMMRALK